MTSNIDTRDIHDDSDVADYGGLTITEIYAKHRRLRGSDLLRYPPTREKRCKLRCGLDDMVDGSGEHRRIGSHTCFLAPHTDGPCEFSSECGLMVRGETQ